MKEIKYEGGEQNFFCEDKSFFSWDVNMRITNIVLDDSDSTVAESTNSSDVRIHSSSLDFRAAFLEFFENIKLNILSKCRIYIKTYANSSGY